MALLFCVEEMALISQSAGNRKAQRLSQLTPERAPMRDHGFVLLFDPDRDTLAMFEDGLVLRDKSGVVACTDFVTARKRLLEDPPDLLVTNLRLEAYNGLHLVY